MQDELYQTEPNLTAEAYRNNCNSEVPKRVEKHLDFLEFSNDGTILLLGTSNLTGRIWSGSVWLFGSPHDAPDMEKCLTGMEIESGAVDGKFFDNSSKIVVGSDSGALQIFGVTKVTDKKDCYLNTYGISCEHDDSISSIDILSDNKVVSGSTDYSVKVWSTENLICEKSYSPAHGHMVTSVSSLPNSSDVFTSTSLDGNALLWDIRLEKPASLLANCNSGYTATTWVSECSVALGAASGNISLVDIRKKNELDRNFCSARPIHKIKCKREIGMLAVSSDDTIVQVLNCKGDVLKSLYKCDKHEDFVRGLAWDSTTNDLYSCGWDMKVLRHEIVENTEDSKIKINSMELNGQEKN